MSRGFVCFNAGSSSLKFAVYVERDGELALASRGKVEQMEGASKLFVSLPDGKPIEERSLAGQAGYATALAEVIYWVEHHLAPAQLSAVGHRVVHGGNRHTGPALVTPALLAELAALSPLAPLHQPHNLAAIGAMARLHPGLPQVACFDTAFHLDSPRVSRLYALPHELAGDELVRYGFHGLSYEHIADALAAVEPRAKPGPGGGRGGRVVAAHLGSGASMCAMVDGRSVASTMGFSALDGLPMATRCGNIDPGLLLICSRNDTSRPRPWSACCTTAPACSACRASAATCANCWRVMSRRRVTRSACSCIASGVSSAHWPLQPAGWMCWSSRAVLANMPPRSGRGYASRQPGWAYDWTLPRTPQVVHGSMRPTASSPCG